MRAKRAKSRQRAWPDDRAIKEVHAEIPLDHGTRYDWDNVNLLSPVSRKFTTSSPDTLLSET
jgi:hypothetical protein